MSALRAVCLFAIATCACSAVDATPADAAPADAAPADVAPADAAFTDVGPVTPNDRGAYLWKGLHHEWLRTFLGFRLPHRVSKLDSFIDEEVHNDAPGWTSTATLHFGQDTGVDGNYMQPVGYFGALHAAGIRVVRRAVHLTWTDDGDGALYPQARSDLSAMVSIDLADLGSVDASAAVLRGLALKTTCDPTKQPPGEICDSDGMWPFRFLIDLAPCVRGSSTLDCPLTVKIYRAWTPNHGGLPPITEKPFTDRLDFDLTVHVTVLAGPTGALAVTQAAPVLMSGHGHDGAPMVGTANVNGAAGGGYPLATAALAGFGFELRKDQDGDIYYNLGRYIGAIVFRISDVGYDPLSGSLSYRNESQIWLPDTVEDSAVDTELHPVLLQLAGDAQAVDGREIAGRLCINSNGAPIWSTWTGCDNPAIGPEQNEDVAKIFAP